VECSDIHEKLINMSGYRCIISTIKFLETQNLTMIDQYNIIKTLKDEIKDKNNALNKLEICLSKNPDLEKFISKENTFEHKLITKYAPLVSVEVERSFSFYKSFLRENRLNFTQESIEMYNIIRYNYFIK
jgi:hypothetical protein